MQAIVVVISNLLLEKIKLCALNTIFIGRLIENKTNSWDSMLYFQYFVA